MKRKLVLMCAIITLLFAGCKKAEPDVIGDESSSLQYQLADMKEWEKTKENSPEQLAMESSRIYQGLLEGSISMQEGFEATKMLATKDVAGQMDQRKAEFEQGIKSTIKSLQNNDQDSIKTFHYSKCIADTEHQGRYIIYRIQEMESGRQYYFRQNFIKEDGQYKVYGNNVENSFGLTGM